MAAADISVLCDDNPPLLPEEVPGQRRAVGRVGAIPAELSGMGGSLLNHIISYLRKTFCKVAQIKIRFFEPQNQGFPDCAFT
jgi:hypothetical protein